MQPQNINPVSAAQGGQDGEDDDVEELEIDLENEDNPQW